MKDRTPFYIESTAYRSFCELCDACREQTKIGMSYGRPGAGKTEASLHYSDWRLIEANLAVRSGVPVQPERLLRCNTLYYKPGITISASRLKSELAVLKNRFLDAKVRGVSWFRPTDWAVELQRKQVHLLVVDEAHRLKYPVLEELRDLQENWSIGLVLIGDPGMERSLGRMFHFSDRVRYLEKFEELSLPEIDAYIDKWANLSAVAKPPDEVCSLIAAYTRGNPRMLGHMFALVERLLKINDDIVEGITSEVVETAREMMLVKGGTPTLIEGYGKTLAGLANAG